MQIILKPNRSQPDLCSGAQPGATALRDCHTGAALRDCSADAVAPVVEPAPVETLRPHPLLQLLDLDGEHVVAFVPSCSRVAVLDAAARALLARLPLGTAPADAATHNALQALEQLGFVTAGDGSLPTPPDPETLVAWLHVTNACNLRCAYCYLEKTGEAMDPAVARAAIDALVRSAQRHGYPALLLKYAGGEATLRMDVVEQTHRYALEQAARYGLRLDAGILSNGTGLTRTTVAQIRQLGLQLMISLDGLGAANDAQRRTIGGAGSTAATLRGIELAIEHGVVPNIAITVTGRSVAGLPDLVGWLLDRDLPFAISLYRENARSASFRDLQLDERRIIEGLRAAYTVVATRPPRWSVLGALLDRADLSVPHRRTCAAGHNYLVIDHHGQVATCQMTIRHPVTSVAAADPLALVRADRTGLQNLPVEQKDGCGTCAWRYWCAGGCPVATFRATGRYDVQSPNCGIYQALYPDLLQLEGRRLLYWAGRSTP